MTEPDRRSFLSVAGLLTAATVVGLTRTARGASAITPGSRDVLLVIDVQNCFVPGGSLAVQKGDEVVPIINRIAKGFRHVVLTQTGTRRTMLRSPARIPAPSRSR